MELLETIILGVAAFSATGFVVSYQWKTRGHWKNSHVGVHMMVFMLSLAAILDIVFIEDLVEDIFMVGSMPWWWEALETGVFATIPIVIIWRWKLLIQFQREGKNNG